MTENPRFPRSTHRPMHTSSSPTALSIAAQRGLTSIEANDSSAAQTQLTESSSHAGILSNIYGVENGGAMTADVNISNLQRLLEQARWEGLPLVIAVMLSTNAFVCRAGIPQGVALCDRLYPKRCLVESILDSIRHNEGLWAYAKLHDLCPSTMRPPKSETIAGSTRLYIIESTPAVLRLLVIGDRHDYNVDAQIDSIRSRMWLT